MKVWLLVWNNKAAITGGVTTIVSTLAAAGMIGADMAVKITACTGALNTLLGVVYTVLESRKV